jgi:hypothetical protein
MPSFSAGINRGARQVREGIETSYYLLVLGVICFMFASIYATLGIKFPIISLYYIIKFVVLAAGLISTVFLIAEEKYWGTLYMSGWTIIILVAGYLGLVSAFDFLLYFVPSIIILIARFADDTDTLESYTSRFLS